MSISTTPLISPHKLLRRANLLADFLAVVDAGTLRAAAQQRHLSQSALTRRIQDLEGELGVRLFDRHVRGMTLTPFGAALRRHAQLIDLSCNYAVGEINDLLGGGAGELRIAAGPAWGYRMVPDAIAAMQEKLPRTRVNLLNRLNETTLPMLSEGRLDLVLGGLPKPRERDAQLVYEPLLEVEHCIFAARGHALAERRGLHPRDVVGLPWVWFAEAVSGRALFTAWCGRARREPPLPAVETMSVQSGFRLLQAGRYLMLLPSTLAPLAAEYGLVALDTREPIGRYASGLMYRESVLRLRAFAELRKELLARAESFSREGEAAL